MSMNDSLRVLAWRGDVLESVHEVSVVVADAQGRHVASWGEPDRSTLLRSAAKPFQALPLVEDGVVASLGLSPDELALCCASHNSEDAHVAGARSILDKAGASEDDLVCGPHPPLREERGLELARRNESLTSVHSNCSGKHAGMLALAAYHGWSFQDYHLPDHPVQRRSRAEVARWTGVPAEELATAVDGCAVVTFGVPLRAVARAGAAFAAASARGDGAQQVVQAMTSHPFMVAGTGRLCTRLMERAGGRLFAKVGAEGVYLAGAPAEGIGVALKVEDGAWRAAPPAVLAVLSEVGLLSADEAGDLSEFGAPVQINTVGARVGHVSVDL